MVPSKDTAKLINYPRPLMHATQSDLVLLLTIPYSNMKYLMTTRKPANLERLLWPKLSRKLMMLMRRHSEMPNQSSNSSRRTWAFGRKKKMATTTLKTYDHESLFISPPMFPKSMRLFVFDIQAYLKSLKFLPFLKAL